MCLETSSLQKCFWQETFLFYCNFLSSAFRRMLWEKKETFIVAQYWKGKWFLLLKRWLDTKQEAISSYGNRKWVGKWVVEVHLQKKIVWEDLVTQLPSFSSFPYLITPTLSQKNDFLSGKVCLLLLLVS